MAPLSDPFTPLPLATFACIECSSNLSQVFPLEGKGSYKDPSMALCLLDCHLLAMAVRKWVIQGGLCDGQLPLPQAALCFSVQELENQGTRNSALSFAAWWCQFCWAWLWGIVLKPLTEVGMTRLL